MEQAVLDWLPCNWRSESPGLLQRRSCTDQRPPWDRADNFDQGNSSLVVVAAAVFAAAVVLAEPAAGVVVEGRAAAAAVVVAAVAGVEAAAGAEAVESLQ